LLDNVVSISTRTAVPSPFGPDPEIIAQLEKMLERAKDGHLQAIFVVGWLADNSVMSGWTGAERASFTLLGGVQQCMNEYLLKQFERR
jgi:hypothetical protein